MNRIFRKVWSPALRAVVVASELARTGAARVAPRNRLGILSIALLGCGATSAHDAGAGAAATGTTAQPAAFAERPPPDHGDAARDIQSTRALEAAAVTEPPPWVGAARVTPRSVIEPPPPRDSAMPGLAQYFSNWVLGNDYQACGRNAGCLQIDRANFNYAFRSIVLNLLQVPNVRDLEANHPANHLTLIGAVHSGSYLQLANAQYFGDNNNASCLIAGLACTWQTSAAQNFQVLVGDGAHANGSNTVVIGTNARHALPNEQWTSAGGPDTDYAARLGHSVLVGHGATGSADRQTILGAHASSTHPNSVALGAGATTARGPQAGYVAPGLVDDQVSAGELSVGAAGANRQITHVAAGSADTDAVNVGQLQGAIAQANAGSALAVTYDDATRGHVALSAAGTTLSNVAAGTVDATSTQAVNGAQLFAAKASIATHLGGGAALDADGRLSAPDYAIQGHRFQNLGAAFAAVDGVLGDAAALGTFAVRYDNAAGRPDLSRITLGDRGAPTTIGNLAAGVAADEAVNLSQLSPVVSALGGGARMDAVTGAVVMPGYTLDDGRGTGAKTVLADVGAALGHLDGGVVGNRADIASLLDGSAGLVRQAGASGAVTVAASSGGLQVDFRNVDGAGRVLGGVADGVRDDDASNVGQLRLVQRQITDLDALAVHYDDATRSSITLGDRAGATLSGVAAGAVAADSTQAINGAQLFGSAQRVAAHLGGGAAIGADGAVSAPTYVMRGGSFDTVGAAFDAVDNAFARIGDGVDALAVSAVRYDTAGGAPDLTRVTFAGTEGTRLANVAAGVADTDAVNLAQLAPAVHALGGGAGIDPVSGAVIGPTYTLDDGSRTGATVRVDNLGAALANLDGRTRTHSTEIAGLLAGTAGLVRQDADTGLIGVGNAVPGAQVDFANRAGAARRLSGVATGTGDTDAVNLAQLRDALVDVNAGNALAVRYDENAEGAPHYGRITLGGGPDGTTLANLAGGALNAASTEAIHGGQLFETHSAIAALLGGGASLTPLGALVAPQYAIQGAFYDSIGAALAALDSGLGAIAGRVDSLLPAAGAADALVGVDGPPHVDAAAVVTDGSHGVAIGASAASRGQQAIAIGGDSAAVGDNTTVVGGSARVQASNGTAIGAEAAIAETAPDAVAVGAGAGVAAKGGVAVGQGAQAHARSSVALGQGSVADRAQSVSVGSVGGERQLTHVAAGTSGTDAVNVNQMHAGIEQALQSANDYTDARLHRMQSDVWEIDRGYRAGVASAMAVAGLPQAYQPGRSMIAAAVSGYEQEAGLAVGITTISESGRWVYKFSGTTNTRNDVGVTLGAGMQW